MSDRDVPCGNKHCQEYWEELINHCEVTSLKRDGVCPNYIPDPTETSIKIQDCRGNVPDNGGEV